MTVRIFFCLVTTCYYSIATKLQNNFLYALQMKMIILSSPTRSSEDIHYSTSSYWHTTSRSHLQFAIKVCSICNLYRLLICLSLFRILLSIRSGGGGAIGGRPLARYLDSVGEELHSSITSHITVAKFAIGTIQSSEGKWLYTECYM